MNKTFFISIITNFLYFFLMKMKYLLCSHNGHNGYQFADLTDQRYKVEEKRRFPYLTTLVDLLIIISILEK